MVSVFPNFVALAHNHLSYGTPICFGVVETILYTHKKANFSSRVHSPAYLRLLVPVRLNIYQQKRNKNTSEPTQRSVHPSAPVLLTKESPRNEISYDISRILEPSPQGLIFSATTYSHHSIISTV